MVILFYVGEKRRPKGRCPLKESPAQWGFFTTPRTRPDRRQSPAAKRRSAKTKFTTVKTLVNNLAQIGQSINTLMLLRELIQPSAAAPKPETSLSHPWPGYAEPEGTWPAAKNAPPGSLLAWRGDARTGQLETLPTLVNKNTASLYLKAYKLCKDQKLIPDIPAETWAALLMVEGRSDFGYNGPDINKKYTTTIKKVAPQAVDPNTPIFFPSHAKDLAKPSQEKEMNLTMTPIRQALMKLGLPENDWRIDFCNTLKDKLDVTKRVGKPFYQVWNGGSQNLNRYQAQLQAVQSPKNKPLMDFIKGITG